MHCFYLVEVAVPQNDAFLGWRDFFFGAQGYVGKITALGSDPAACKLPRALQYLDSRLIRGTLIRPGYGTGPWCLTISI